jgi:hypothetical protein
LDLFLFHIQELLHFTNAGGVYDYLAPVLPPDFTPHVFTPIEQVEHNELLPVQDGAQLFFRVDGMV